MQMWHILLHTQSSVLMRDTPMEISEALQAQQQVVRLQALLEASRQLHSTIQLDEVLRIALQIVVRELELAGAFFTNFPQIYGEIPPALPTLINAGLPP